MSLNINLIMESSKKEFTIICAGMIHSDNIVDLNEIKYCHRLIVKMFGEIVTYSEFLILVNDYDSKNLSDVLSSFYRKNKEFLSRYEKEYLLTTLIILGLSDFEITTKEVSFLEDFAKILKVNPKTVHKLIDKTIKFTEKIKPENII